MLKLNQKVVAEGTFLYAGAVECNIRIVCGPIRYGSGDHEDPPEVSEDAEHDTYYVEYGSTTEKGKFNAGGGGFPSLQEAKASAESAPGIGPTVRWKP